LKINLNSILFKTLSILFISFILFAIFILISAKQTFQKGYIDIINEKILIIERNISPPIALNLSYGFDKATKEIMQSTLFNPNILLIKVESPKLKDSIIFSKNNRTLLDFFGDDNFNSNSDLIDPATSEVIGKLTLIYSNTSYKKYMEEFYSWLTMGIILLTLSLFLISFYIYHALKNLSILDKFLRNFNPAKPTFISLNKNSKDEITSISSSANIMIENIIKYINYSKTLNERISEQQKHLKNAQRMAHVGSWEYNLITKELSLSDEMYRMLNTKLNTQISWDDFLGFISQKDDAYIRSVLSRAVENGSTFNIKYTLNLKNGQQIDIHTEGKVRKKADGSSKMTSVSRDITQEIKNKKTIEQLAYFDSLTKLPNRTLLKDRVHKALQNASREKEKVALIFLDLDHFKLINDTLGHNTGDELLIYVSKVLKKQIREADTLARLGGDEFVALLPSIKNIKDVEYIADKLLKALQGKHDINTHQLYITTSIGISIYPDNSKDISELITNADTAMYDAKQDGRNNYKIYSSDMGNHISKQMEIEQDLREALKNKNELEIYYQPKIDTTENFVSGAEALIRWNHPTKGLMFPDEFIGVAESTGMILDMGNWIIDESIYQVQEWNRLGLVGLKVAINLSPRQFQDKHLVPHVSALIEKYQVDPTQLEFEVTETMSMSNIDATLRILDELKTIGVSVAIDDFGTGYSSLSYLKKFPVNTIKIDKSFVMDMVEDEGDKIIVETIITMAHTLGFITVAEGVETEEHVNILKDMGCDQLQGYHYSKAIPKDKFTDFLKDYNPNL